MVPSQPSNVAETSGPSASRRTVLRLAGATAGTGLLAGRAAGETDSEAESATIAVSPSHRAAVAGTLDRLEEPTAGTLSIETVGSTAGFRRFADGEIDLLVGSRPILAGERARALENDVGYETREVATSLATLDPPAASWSDCLRPASLAATWSSDDSVETWAEVSSAEGDSIAESAPGRNNQDGFSHDADVESTLVRGVRSHQYAAGAGGVGYYEPDTDWIDAGAESMDTGSTALVQLSYLYGDRSVLDRSALAAFLETYGQVSAERVGDVAYYADQLGQ